MKTLVILLASLAVSIAADAMAQARVTPLWVGPAYSGSWYSRDRSGEGFTLQVLDNGTALALWFTYPPAGGAGEQAWIYAEGGRVEAHRIRFENAFTTRGPRFGPGFDPAQFQLIPWGMIEFRFDGCNTGEVRYEGPSAWGSGVRRLERLTALSELECSGKRHVTGRGARAASGLRQRSGSWFDPSHNGEGWSLEELPDGRALVYWFTYDERGEQAWTVGESAASGDRVVIDRNLRPLGTRFGAAFDPAQVTLVNWGRLELEFEGCDRGSARYASSTGAFGSGTLRPVRLTRLAGTACRDSAASVPANGSWSAGATMPGPQSEHAIASIGALMFVAGGFGDSQGFKRYDAATNTWTVLPNLPSGRDHAVAAAFAGHIYVTGGNANGPGDQAISGWRFSVAQSQWSTVPELPHAIAGSGVALGGFLYFADASGELHQFDPRTRATRVIRGDGRAQRDHSQVVAFQGEIWWIGGRGPETPAVSIYDPASESWRDGPSLDIPRAGFAAAASDTLIMVAGGEVLSGTPRTLDTVEAIAAGQDAWTRLPSLPTAMHGFVAAIHGNAFHALGGSTLAGTFRNPGIVQIFRWNP